MAMSSPMAKPLSLLPLQKRKSTTHLAMNKKSAAEQLTAVFQRHAERESRIQRSSSVTTGSTLSTPALSYHTNSASSADDDTDYELHDDPLARFAEPDIAEDDGLEFPPNKAAPTSEHAVVPHAPRHSEFGHCVNEAFRYESRYRGAVEDSEATEQDPSYDALLSTYLSYIFLILLGHMRDFFGKILFPDQYTHLRPHHGYAALNSDFDSFYTRRMKMRLDDCFSRPVTGVPGRTIMLLDRTSDDFNHHFKFTGSRTRALNVSSYNYLGFAQARGGCADAVEESIRRYGISPLAARLEGGSLDLHGHAEQLVARFMGTEDALITSMGFATNSTNLPALVSKGCLVISDELNHASIRFGVRLSGASVRMFRHNDMNDLEKLLREVISQGQPRTHRPWKKILLIIEGLYSMEGTMCNLPAILELKSRYKFYLFIDEAHSVGALGPHGRGVTDYFGVNPRDVDLLMGTFTKSFGAAGGYIAGNKTTINRLRLRSHASNYAESITPSVLTQIVASMGSIMGVVPDSVFQDQWIHTQVVPSVPALKGASSRPTSSSSVMTTTVNIASAPLAQSLSTAYMSGDPRSPTSSSSTALARGPAPNSALPPWLTLPPHLLSGEEGRTRLRRLAFNCRYLARALKKLGFLTYGHPSSPIVPLLLFHPGKMPSFSRFMLQRKTPIVVVVVGYPATPLTLSRVRFCLSAAHTKEDVDLLLEACDEIGDWLDLKRGCPKSERWSLDEIKRRAVELVEI